MPRLDPEAEARKEIDRQLVACGGVVQDRREMNISASLGVAIREFTLTTGEADYMLYADGRAIGVVEAKPVGHTLTGVTTKSGKYCDGLLPDGGQVIAPHSGWRRASDSVTQMWP